MKKRSLVFLALFSLLFSSCQYHLFNPVSQNEEAHDNANNSNSTIQQDELLETRVSVLATGDNLIHGALYLQALRRGQNEVYDFTYLYENIAPFLRHYDMCYINQETLINRIYEPSTYPTFSSPPELGAELYRIGFRIFSLSNNHTYDKGAGGISATIDYWNTMPNDILTTGLYENADSYMDIPVYEINGIVFAFLAYTEHTNGLPTPYGAAAHVIYTNNEKVMEQQVRYAREVADVVVVCPHWGVEGSHTVSEAQYNLVKKINSWGADIILGSHPHVIQKIEQITNEETGQKTTVIYSLSNFVSAQSSPDNMIGGFFTFDAVKELETTVIENIQFHPVITHYGTGYSNVRAYLYHDYTEQLANAHGIRTEFPYFNYQYIRTVLEENISPEYLVLS